MTILERHYISVVLFQKSNTMDVAFWIEVKELIVKIIIFFLVIGVCWFLYFIGEMNEYDFSDDPENLDEFNKRFYPNAEDWKRFAWEFKADWTHEQKVKFIIVSKKYECGEIVLGEEADFFKSLLEEKPKKPEPEIIYNSEIKPKIQNNKNSLKPRKEGDNKIYLKKIDKQTFEL